MMSIEVIVVQTYGIVFSPSDSLLGLQNLSTMLLSSLSSLDLWTGPLFSGACGRDRVAA